MIYRLSKRDSDLELLKNYEAPRTKRDNEDDIFSNVVVKKPWGYEYLAFENEHVAIWVLQLVRKRRTSMHCHPLKKTGLILLSGEATFRSLDSEISLGSMDAVVIDRGVFHSSEASSELPIFPVSENGIWLMEIESPPYKGDLVRLKDEYGRAGSAYEGQKSMIERPKECLQLEIPSNGVFQKEVFDYMFTTRKGPFLESEKLPDASALVSIIGRGPKVKSTNPYLEVGGISLFSEFYEKTRQEDLSEFVMLIVERRPKLVKVSDYVFSFIQNLGVEEVFFVSGGGAMHLVDSLADMKNIRHIAMHHEQAAAMAAEGYARISGKPGVALVTTGPGGTNTITGLYGAWIDSIPVVFIAGQVPRSQMIGDSGLRQLGVQESDMVNLVKPITKYAVTVDDPSMIKYHLQKAYHLATTGRPGPVWLEFTLDIQGKITNLEELKEFVAEDGDILENDKLLSIQVADCISMLEKAERPLIYTGYGIRLAHGEDVFSELVKMLNIPVVCSWTTSDLIPFDHDCFIGRCGIFGDRAGNFSVQNSDLLIILGSRMSIPQIGYNPKVFAREAKRIVVDIDKKELEKKSLQPDLAIQNDVKKFMLEMLRQLREKRTLLEIDPWLKKCRGWKEKYPVVLTSYRNIKDSVNSFYFIDVLSEKLDNKAVLCTDMGTSFTCTMQTFRIKKGQRLFTSSGHAPMGFGLPGAIGACGANNRKKTICISGDGGLQMNIQELQTLVHYKLPIILFLLNNGGYLTIKLMQQNHFGRYVGAEKSSGLSCPDMIKLAKAYGIGAERISNNEELHSKIDNVLAQPGPYICEIMMSETQALIPRISSIKKPDGSIVSQPLENLFPFLDKEEFDQNMIIKPLEGLNQ